LHEENSVSLKEISRKYGNVMADAVAIKLDILNRFGVENYDIIPTSNSFQLYLSE
jgi:hypothetical protein